MLSTAFVPSSASHGTPGAPPERAAAAEVPATKVFAAPLPAEALLVASAATALLGTRAAAKRARKMKSAEQRTVSLKAFENELGVQAPVGFWDPAGLAKDGNADAFRRRRETEIKHGRISMIACIGYITPEFFKWPGYLSPSLGIKFGEVPNGLGALSKVPAAGLGQFAAFIAFLELSYNKPSGE